MSERVVPPIHPGEILLEEFMKPLGISQNRLGRELDVPPRRINEIVHGKRSISADTALRLGAYFKMSPQFWLNLQGKYDLDMAEEKMGGQIKRIKPFRVVSENTVKTGTL